ncbi:hypothetical protein HYS49_01650 [Candidatus Woesearchaeota archaeon]|nr:hypothetical protein [Candidatus Woesearchaeota archaeon]
MAQQLEQHLYTELEEKLMAETLREYYTEGLSPYDGEQVRAILKEQFKEGNTPEVGGGIFRIEKGLEFCIKKSKWSLFLEKTLKRFAEGEEDNRGFLLTIAVKNAKEIQVLAGEAHHHYRVLDMLCTILQKPMAFEDEQTRKDVAILYRDYVLSPKYYFNPLELGAGQMGFNGSFHVHYLGTPPTNADIQVSKRVHFPGLLISATKDFQQSGLTLYLVHSQGYEKLYQGPFPSEEHINP